MKQNIKQKHTTTNITRTNTRHQPWRRVLAALLIQALLTVMVIAPGKRLLAEPYSQYGDGSPREQEFKRVLERAKKQEDKTAWENYVALGLAMATRDWEDDAFAVLREEYEKINADENLEEDEKELKKAEEQAQYRAAAIAWESDVQETILQERGKYLAAKAAETVVARDITEEEYQTLLAELENRLVVENELDLSGWEANVAELHGPLKQRFEENLKAQFDAILQSYSFLSGDERTAFEDQLKAKEEKIRRDFEQKDELELIGARNRLYLEHKQDTDSAKLESEKESAEATGNDVINATKSELATLTDKLYQDAVTDMEELTTGPESDIDPDLWAKRMEAIIDTGLRKWELAEQDLFEKRLTWREGRQTSRSEAEKIWKTNHESLQSEMKNWLEDIQEKILAGRTEWENRIAEMKQSRQTAETELAEYVTRRREQFGASSQQLSNIVLGGGQALLEAKNAFRYYSELIVQSGYIQPGGNLDDTNQYLCHTFTGNDAALCNFYRDERAKLGASIASFTTILNNTETTLGLMMHSDQGDSGYLNDVRNYAGALPEEIAALPEADFKTELQTLMAAKSEDFLLYKEDVTNLMGENELFVDRALELVDASNFDYNAAANITELAEMIGKLEGAHYVHKQELARIFNTDRDESLDEDAKLAAIKAEIKAWLAPYTAAKGDAALIKTAVDKRLRERVLAYFGEGDRGYYLSGEENDPYLMTRAEYEWELLRRQRNYQARRLRRAQAVKEYADLASRHDAALEMAQVTTERTEAARIHAELNELAYLILKGDLEFDPGVYNPDETIAQTKIQAEWERLLTERNIQPEALAGIDTRLDQEASILSDMAALTNPTAGELNELIGRITVYLESNNLSEHRLNEVRRKLEEHRRQVLAGADAGALENQLDTLKGLAGALLGQVNTLKEDYDIGALNTLILKIKGDGASDRGLIGLRSMPQINASQDEVKERIKANAELLKTAQEKLDEVRKEYHNAFVDLQVLTSGDASELIQIELSEATNVLTSTLNRMQKIETIPGFEDKILDQSEAARLAYLSEVSEGEAAAGEYRAAGAYLIEVQALEESKKRKLALETTLTEPGFDINNIVESAATLITKESELVNRDAENVSLRSATHSRAAFDRLKAAKQAYDQELLGLADLSDPSEIAEAKTRISNLKENLARRIELLAAALRGEYTSRQKRVALFLDQPADLETLETNLKDESETLEENVYNFAGDAAEKLESFLSANSGKTYLELLEIINAAIKVHQDNRTLNMSSSGYGVDTADSVNEYNELRVARNLLMNMKAAIEHTGAAADEFDGRDQARRWADILKEIRNIAADADFHKTFAAAIPDEKTDSWVSDFRTKRTALLARLDAVIAQADPYTAYKSLSVNDREILAFYGSIDGKLAKSSLETIRRSISVDLKSLEFSYKEIYLREMALKESKKAALIEPELERLSRDVRAKFYELGELKRNKRELETAGGDASRIALIQTRIEELEAELTPLEANLELKENEYRQSINAIKEARSPGSTSTLFQAALGEFYDDTQGLNVAAASYRELAGYRVQKETEEQESTAGELVKGILGFYKTDAKGELLRDSAGKPLATDEYLALLNGQAINTDISEVLAGDVKGPDLELWVGRLQDYLRDKERAAKTPAELRAAVELLEESLLEYRAAIAMIENGDSTGEVLKAEAQNRLEKAEVLAEKLALVANMEAGLNQIITETAQARERALGQAQAAEAQGQSYTGTIPDVTDAALAFLGRIENVKLFQLFKGYDAEGNVDGVVDARLQERLDEIRLLADRLRENRYEAAIGGAQKQYAEFQRENLAILTGLETGENTVALWPDIENFLESYTALSGQELNDEVDALPAAGFRAAIFSLLENTNSEKTLYLDKIAAILARESGDGIELKTKIKDALTAAQERLKNELRTFGENMDAYVDRNRDLQGETDVAELLAAYAGRGEVARTKLLPEFANLDAASTVADAKTWPETLADTHFSDGVYISIRSEIYRVADRLEKTYTTGPQEESDRIQFLTDLQTQVTDYLNSITAPTNLAQIEEELQTARLREALAVAGLGEEYNAEDFAPELREFVLVYQYSQAESRYAEYLKNRDENSVLDLRGINGAIANRILVKDFEDYMTTQNVADFISNANSPRYLADYLQAYFTERNTSSEFLPAGGLELLERVARQEFQRINDPAHVDEQTVFADFKDYIYLSRGQDYVVRNGITLNGADDTARRANFDVDFAGFWTDGAYTFDGKTMGERYPGIEQRENIANLIFSELLYPTALTDYLPGVLSETATEGRLNEALKTADEYLPAELLAIADYQNKDYRALAAGVGEYTAAELARLEVGERLSYEELTLAMSDAELGAILERAGQSDAPPAVQAELLNMMKHLAESRAAEGASSAAAAINLIRQNRVIFEQYPDTNEREAVSDFLAARRGMVEVIEAKFFAELSNQNDELREKAKLDRGLFFASLTRKHGGVQDAFYNGLSVELQGEFDKLVQAVFVDGTHKLDEDEINDLNANLSDYQKLFDLRSGQELVVAGIFEAAETTVLNGLLRSADPATVELVRANRNAATASFLNMVYYGAAHDDDPSAYVDTTGIPGLKAELLKIYESLDPEFKKALAKEELMLTRLTSKYLEDDTERNRLRVIFNDPALFSKEAAWRPDYELDKSLAITGEQGQELESALFGLVQAHGIFFEKEYREMERERYVAGRLRDYARERGDDLRTSTFANYRTYMGAERTEQIKQYRTYITGLITAAVGANDTARAEALGLYQTVINAGNDPETWAGALTIVNAAPGDEVKSFGELFNGQILMSDSLEIADTKDLLLNQDWQNILTSDVLKQSSEIKVGDESVQVRELKTVLPADVINTVGGDFGAHMEKIHYANLANNYLEAVSNLHRGLMDVFRAAKLAETRKTKTASEIKQKFILGYDPHIAATQDLDNLREIQNAASARKDAHGTTERQNAYNVVSGVEKQRQEAADKFAQAGRRGLIVNNDIQDLIENRFTGTDGVKNRFENARAEVEQLSNEAEALRNEYGEYNTEYVNRLNETAAQFRAYTQTLEEYERLQAVQDYAETPYLHVGSDEDGNDYSGDALAEYNLALAAYNQAQEALKNAAVDMQGQGAKLERFNKIVTVLEGTDEGLKATLRNPLTDEERKELAEYLEENETLTPEESEKLTGFLERHTYELYGEMIVERAAYIKHSMRMVRMHKANEIVNAEIEQRRAIVAEKERQFQSELNRRFDISGISEANRAAGEAAQLAVYKRLSSIVESGGSLYNEYRAWYWGAGTWAQSAQNSIGGSSSLDQLRVPQVTMTQQLEAFTGFALDAGINATDKEQIRNYLALGGRIEEFNTFAGTYYGSVMTMGQYDLTKTEAVITKTTMTAAIAASSAMIGTGSALVAAGMGLISTGNMMLASMVGAPFAGPYLINGGAFVAAGSAMIATGGAGVYTATLAIAASEAKLALMTSALWLSVGMSAMMAEDREYVIRVREKEREYQEALGALEYFTKVRDVKTLKERIIAWGEKHGDTEAGSDATLYKITEEDLKYIYDTGNGAANYRKFKDENDVIRELTTDEKTDALDISLKKRETVFKSVAGDEYDPNSIQYINPGPPLGGYYYIGGEKHVEVRALQHDGSYATGYAKVIADSKRNTYDMGEVLQLAITHGENLRQEAKVRYYGAGNAVGEDQFFLLGERDTVNEKIFDQASARTEGGKEFSGYRMAFAEYQQNVNAVVEAELSQKIAIQRQEWDLREQELADKYDAWSRKMATILKRGKQSWNQAIDNFRDNWITWEKEQDAQEAEIEKQWDEKIKEHFKRKADWENNIKTKFQETTVRGSLDGLIDDLNNQIISFSANTGIDMDELNKLAEINKALDEIKAQLPTEAEQLNALNKNIKNFKTTLAISEISSSDFLGQIQGDTRAFSAQMKEHSYSMRTVANVKAMEQYKKLLDQFKFQLDDRNAKVAKQTRNAAMAQGYVQVGDKFVKKGATVGVYGVVNAYEYFDTEGEFIKALSETGVDSVNGEGLVTFLKEKSQIEVTTYFHTQKLAIQGAMNKLMGTGDASVRESSRDAKDIGRIGVWIGGQGNSDLANRTLTEMNKRGLYSRDAYMRDLLANNAMFGGFGQLGSATWRPGEKQILGGFYTQLSWMGGEMGKRDAANSQGKYTPGPAAAMLNQFNVGLMAANSYKNVEMAAALQGKSRGYMWEAQGLAMISQPLIAVGNGLAVAATLSGGAAWMAPVGLAIKALGESIKVDAQTGKRSFNLTDKQKVNLAVDSAMSALTMGANSYFTTAKMGYNQAKFLKESLGYVKMATNLGMAGVQEDEHGKIDGWKADENFALSATGILVGKFYGGSDANDSKLKRLLGVNFSGAKHSLATGITNKAIQLGNEYYKFKNNRANQYAQLANPGPEGIGGLFGMGIDAYVAQHQKSWALEQKIKEEYGEGIYNILAEKGKVPGPWNPVRENQTKDILLGAARLADLGRRATNYLSNKAMDIARRIGGILSGGGQGPGDIEINGNRITDAATRILNSQGIKVNWGSIHRNSTHPRLNDRKNNIGSLQTIIDIVREHGGEITKESLLSGLKHAEDRLNDYNTIRREALGLLNHDYEGNLKDYFHRSDLDYSKREEIFKTNSDARKMRDKLRKKFLSAEVIDRKAHQIEFNRNPYKIGNLKHREQVSFFIKDKHFFDGKKMTGFFIARSSTHITVQLQSGATIELPYSKGFLNGFNTKGEQILAPETPLGQTHEVSFIQQLSASRKLQGIREILSKNDMPSTSAGDILSNVSDEVTYQSYIATMRRFRGMSLMSLSDIAQVKGGVFRTGELGFLGFTETSRVDRNVSWAESNLNNYNIQGHDPVEIEKKKRYWEAVS